jgi:hypothetical protein
MSSNSVSFLHNPFEIIYNSFCILLEFISCQTQDLRYFSCNTEETEFKLSKNSFKWL